MQIVYTNRFKMVNIATSSLAQTELDWIILKFRYSKSFNILAFWKSFTNQYHFIETPRCTRMLHFYKFLNWNVKYLWHRWVGMFCLFTVSGWSLDSQPVSKRVIQQTENNRPSPFSSYRNQSDEKCPRTNTNTLTL